MNEFDFSGSDDRVLWLAIATAAGGRLRDLQAEFPKTVAIMRGNPDGVAEVSRILARLAIARHIEEFALASAARIQVEESTSTNLAVDRGHRETEAQER